MSRSRITQGDQMLLGLVKDGKETHAVKELRVLTGWGLRDAVIYLAELCRERQVSAPILEGAYSRIMACFQNDQFNLLNDYRSSI